MPEITEVERLRGQLDTAWGGRVIVTIENVRKQDQKYIQGMNWFAFRATLAGRLVKGVHRHDKHLMVELDGDLIWLIHLRSTGWWLPGDPAARLATPPDPLVKHFIHASAINPKSLRVSLFLRSRDTDPFVPTRQWDYHDPRTWGSWRIVTPVDLIEFKAPDWLQEPQLAAGWLVAHSSARTAKDVLCDQGVTAGLGNYLSCEALHRAGIHPHTRWNKINSVRRQILGDLHIPELIAECLKANDHSHWRVFKRKGKPCPACGMKIEYVKDRGGARGSYYCPRCQPMV